MTPRVGHDSGLAAATDEPIADLTHVELIWKQGRIEHWIRFGHTVREQTLDRQRRVVSFAPGSIFAFVRWAANEHGTIISRVDVVRAVRLRETFQTLPFVRPGGELLLKIMGWPKVQSVLEAIDAIETRAIDPADAAPDYWRHLSGRLTAGEPPIPYRRDQHHAWLLRQIVGQ